MTKETKMMWESIGAMVLLALAAYAGMWGLKVQGDLLDLQEKLARQGELARQVQKETKAIKGDLDRLEIWVLKEYRDQGETRVPPIPPEPKDRRAAMDHPEAVRAYFGSWVRT